MCSTSHKPKRKPKRLSVYPLSCTNIVSAILLAPQQARCLAQAKCLASVHKPTRLSDFPLSCLSMSGAEGAM